ncbi:uncharacterized protein BDR25DRAFT_229817 [Lindgomyces ingoldianus]|uniref:Uncharacterized protein n=1 Tax=Lindgomyces ingoldianus TaxID=673940 RepID=A0ACB6QQG0_9PLEO|nr:uncharacterized protein BDR25DRAFT_229817 [Lindgomyces ingoldianus]KAF2469151.1 hypothetical protein BDR25DRAFT_229817 [Lindgomyces ingoldianus]
MFPFTRSLFRLLSPTSAHYQRSSLQSSPRPILRQPLRHSPQVLRFRCLHASQVRVQASSPPKSRDRGPKSNEDTQTDFGALDILRNTAAPATAIDACTNDGFALNNQMRVSGSGILLVGGEAFRWRPWSSDEKLKNAKGQWEVQNGAWGVLELVWPKPDLLIIGTGPQVAPISPSVRTYLSDLGIRIDIQDTRNAAAQFNLLATERGVSQVAAALIPVGWKEGR